MLRILLFMNVLHLSSMLNGTTLMAPVEATTTTIMTTMATTTLQTTTPRPQHFNKTVITPNSITFECRTPNQLELTQLKVKKDGADFFSMIVKDGRFDYDTDMFVAEAGPVSISVKLKTTVLSDQGEYVCYVTSTTERVDQSYSLIVQGCPNVSLVPANTSYTKYKTQIFQVTCTVSGRPKSLPKWDGQQIIISDVAVKLSVYLNETKTYTFVCAASNGIPCNKDDINRKTVQVDVLDSRPSKPANIKAIAEEKSVMLTWVSSLSGISDLKGYTLLGFDGPKRILSKILPPSQLSYNHDGLQPYHEYVYKLIACNLDTLCSDNVSISARTLPQARPLKPTNISSKDISPYSISLSFIHGLHLSNVNVSYTEFCLPLVLNDNAEFTCGRGECTKVGIENTLFTANGLQPFSNYSIAARTCIDNLTCSNCAMTTVATTRTASTPVTNLNVTNGRDKEIEVYVSWEPPSSLNSLVVYYKIRYEWKTKNTQRMIKENDTGYYSNSFDSPQCQQNSPVNLSPRCRRNSPDQFIYRIKDLVGSTLYRINIYTINSGGNVSPDATIDVSTYQEVPSAPINLKLVDSSHDSLSIEWKPSSSDSIVHSYLVVYIKQGCISCKREIQEVKSKTEAVITNLKQSSLYVVSVSGQILRKEIHKMFAGDAVSETFTTKKYIPPAHETSKGLLVGVTVIMLILLILVIIGAILYCRRHGLCSVNFKPTFYGEKSGGVPLSLRQSLKTIETKRVPMSKEELEVHIQDLHANSDYLFSEEYSSLGPNRPDRTFHSAHAAENASKNRYQDIAPYDQTRVRLMSLDGVPGSNYINANFVDGYHKVAAYIATQAPLNHTTSDFWRMVWESNSRVIVMLTNLMERGRKKCDQYWPSEKFTSYRGFDVTLESTQCYATYVVRELSVVKKSFALPSGLLTSPGEARTIWQYHYTEWPDFGVPRERASVLSFILRTREHENESSAPPILHCSAGVGRTGTFLVLDSQMRRFDHRQDIEIYNFIKKIRQQRSYLVQQECQYIFIHNVLLDYASAGNTQIPLMDLEMTLNQDYWSVDPNVVTKLQKEWQLHEQFTIAEHLQSSGQRPCNRPKNRDQNVIPVDATRVHLIMKAAVEGSDYINASFVDSFRTRRAYIVTQAPLQDTLEDFWRMVWESHSQILVNLLTFEEIEQGDYFAYMPNKLKEKMYFGKIDVQVVDEKAMNNYVKRTLVVKNSDESDCGERRLHHFHFYNWPHDFFPRTAFLFELMVDVLQCKQGLTEHSSSPIVIQCRCGVGRSGMICALFNLKEQMEDATQIIDLYSTVRMLAFQRPCMIYSQTQYDYLYKALVALKHFLNENTA